MGLFQPIRERLTDEEHAIVDYINLTLSVRQMSKTHLASAMGENVLRIYNCLSKRTHLQEDLKIQIFKTLGIRNTDVQSMIDGMPKKDAQDVQV